MPDDGFEADNRYKENEKKECCGEYGDRHDKTCTLNGCKVG